MFNTWWIIPLIKWVITPVINGISRVNPLITGVITHLLSGMSHQVTTISYIHWNKTPMINQKKGFDIGPIIYFSMSYIGMIQWSTPDLLIKSQGFLVEHSHVRINIWLVVWTIFDVSIYWEESSQLIFIFFRGVGLNHQPVKEKDVKGLISPIWICCFFAKKCGSKQQLWKLHRNEYVVGTLW